MVAMKREGKGYDNKTPREQQARLTGWGKRALAAHQNSFEITPVFVGCVLMGHLSNGNLEWSDRLAIIFVVSRVLYTALYLADWDKFRSLIWGLGLACSFGIGLSSVIF